MKLASYIADGKEAYGVVIGDGVVTMNNGSAAMRPCATRWRPARWPRSRRLPMRPSPTTSSPTSGSCRSIPNPHKILCAGINYQSHAAETGRELPKQPSMFIRLTNTLVGHEGEMIRPKLSDNFDFEGELAMVIGKGGRHIPMERALDHVAGYTMLRRRQRARLPEILGDLGQEFARHRPARALDRDVGRNSRSRRKLTLTTRLNGQQVQHSGTDMLIYSVPQIVGFCSDFTTLLPGDVIATGTPEGVGHRRKPPLWMKPGDVLEVEISGIGVLRTRIVDEK